MTKLKHKSVTFSAEERTYELPAELDVKRLDRLGIGVETVTRLAERSKRMIGLDADVAEAFPDSEAVNAMPRAIITGLPK